MMRNLILLVLLSTLISCGGDDQFFPAQDLEATPLPTNPVAPIKERPENLEAVEEEVIYDCSSELEEVVVDVSIPESNNVCEWGIGENLSKKNSFTRAKKETPIGFTLPDNATICSLEITSQKDVFKYDDHLYLTLNNSIIFSSFPDHMTDLMVPGTDIPQFDWELLVNQKFDNSDKNRFCLGSEVGSTCIVPQTQRTGEMRIHIVDEVVQNVFALGANDEQKQTHVLNLIISGDNDGSDCKHSAMDLKVRMKIPKIP